MPDRFLREGVIRSDRYNALSLDARDLFMRLLLIADDFGCYDGRENVIAHNAYYHGRTEPLPIAELHLAGLIVRYTNAGKPYLAINQWSEQLRLRRTFPAPPVNTDRPDAAIRGKFGRAISWKNPAGTDAVSILLDINGRPIAPQPQEWRRVNDDWTPLDRAQPGQTIPTSSVTGHQSLQSLPQGTGEKPTTGIKALPPVPERLVQQVPFRNIEQEQLRKPLTGAVAGDESTSSALPQRLATPSPAPSIVLEDGRFKGVTEAQCERWQGMFASMSIPDQLERAAAWLEVNQAERDAILAQGDGFGPFIVRWLLREARGEGTVRAKGSHDS